MSAPRPSADASSNPSRRKFLGTTASVTSSAIAAGGLAGAMIPRAVHAAENDAGRTLKVALIGCGGRGSGAGADAMKADPNVKLTVMADLFPDQLAAARARFSKSLGDRYAVDDAHAFTGFDAYKKVMETDVDIVCLCTPPHFRPVQLRAAIEAGKHVFCEKPVAVDAPGVRHVLETTEMAEKKNLSIVSGLCWRYDHGVRETIKQIKDGAIGDIVAIQENYLTGTLWQRSRQPSWTEMEYQVRNWLYYTWLSGDHNVEQHIHSLDKALWLNNDELPTRCYGMGGRQVRTDPIYGNIYDHHAVCYEFATGVKVFSFTRQMDNCFGETEDHILGSKGTATVIKNTIRPKSGPAWQFKGPKPNMYQVEHAEMVKGIRSGKVLNNGVYMSRSTMMAIMGRMATYTGKAITGEMAMNSQEALGPKEYAWGEIEIPKVPMPGQTKFI